MTAPLDARRVVSGNYAYVYDVDGNQLTSIFNIQANIEVGIEEVRSPGTRWIGNKQTTLKGTGSATGYLVTTEWIEKMSQVADDKSSPYVTELIIKLHDPESHGAYRVRLKNVMFDNIPLVNAEVGSIVENEYTFVFSGHEFLDRIRA
ncbi:phage tail tube protein [Neobacillus mesonae]|nr:phage tail tube protein [Neobacillus mesonae]